MENHADEFDIITCFFNSALSLHISSLEGMRLYLDGDSVSKNWVEKLIMAFYLYRQGLEAVTKALIKEKTGAEITGHDLKRLWQVDIKLKKSVRKKVEDAILVLEKFKALENTKLFQYHDEPHIEDLSIISKEEFAVLDNAAWALYEELLLVLRRQSVKTEKISAQILEFKAPKQ